MEVLKEDICSLKVATQRGYELRMLRGLEYIFKRHLLQTEFSRLCSKTSRTANISSKNDLRTFSFTTDAEARFSRRMFTLPRISFEIILST